MKSKKGQSTRTLRTKSPISFYLKKQPKYILKYKLAEGIKILNY